MVLNTRIGIGHTLTIQNGSPDMLLGLSMYTVEENTPSDGVPDGKTWLCG